MSRLTGLAVALALAGCLHLGPEPVAEPTAPDPAVTALVEAALRAEAALARLGRVRAAERPAAAPTVPALAPPELLQPVTLDWTGPLDPLARRLAELAGYRFVTAGRPPHRPPVVSVAPAAEPLLLVLRDAGVQAADKAVLEVDPDRRLIGLTWSPGDGVERSTALAPAAAPLTAVESDTVPPLPDWPAAEATQ